MPGKKDLKPHVHEHLRRRKVDPGQVPDPVIDVLNDCSEDELKAMDRVGAAMEAEKVDPPLRVSMVH
jgi:hypothetical protein